MILPKHPLDAALRHALARLVRSSPWKANDGVGCTAASAQAPGQPKAEPLSRPPTPSMGATRTGRRSRHKSARQPSPHPGPDYTVPPAPMQVTGQRRRATNTLNWCQRFSDNMASLARSIQYCRHCNEQWWSLQVTGAFGACKFCTKIRNSTGSWPWRADNDTDAVSDATLLAFANNAPSVPLPPAL